MVFEALGLAWSDHVFGTVHAKVRKGSIHFHCCKIVRLQDTDRRAVEVN